MDEWATTQTMANDSVNCSDFTLSESFDCLNDSTTAVNCSNFTLRGVDQDLACLSVAERTIHGVVMGLILLSNLVANITVLALVYRYKSLRQKSILVTLGLVLVDLLTGVLWVFQAEASIIAGEWPFGDRACRGFAYFYVATLYVRWCEILAFTNDRFCQIFFPFWYEKWANWLIVISTALAWLIPAIVSLPTIILDIAAFYLTLTACSVNCGENVSCANSVIALFGFFIIIGSVIPTIMYILAYIYGWRKKISMQRRLQMGSGEGIPRNESINNFLQRFAKERRALTTCFLVFITNIFTNVLIYFTTSVRSREEIYQNIPIWVHFLATYIFLLGTVLDPIVVMRTKDFREKLNIFSRKMRLNGTISKALHNIIDFGISEDRSVKVTSLSNGSASQTVIHSASANSNSVTNASNGVMDSNDTDTEC